MLDNLPNAELTRIKTQKGRQEKLKTYKQQLCSQIITKIEGATNNGKAYAEISYIPIYDETEINDIVLELKDKGYKVIKPKDVTNGFIIEWG